MKLGSPFFAVEVSLFWALRFILTTGRTIHFKVTWPKGSKTITFFQGQNPTRRLDQTQIVSLEHEQAVFGHIKVTVTEFNFY